jgi:mRNA interferase RelE/StbE
MTYKIEIERQAKKELYKLPKQAIQTLVNAIDELAIDPFPPGAKKLIGRTGFRIRCGNYRVLYVIDTARKLVRIFRVGDRKEIYRK